ncbi:MAG: TlpA family protein disulfide reductase [Alphaproteobacteria bacterium]|nr:MAG: TlpA family protein disulfide reductase [Alphaproteobacteria bacterium]
MAVSAEGKRAHGLGATRRRVLIGAGLTGLFPASVLTASPAAAQSATRPAFQGDSRPLVWHDEPRPLPEVEFSAVDGTEVRWSTFTGRVVVLNLWATWCAPCVKEMPALLRLSRALGRDALVLPLSQDRAGLSVVEPFYTSRGLTDLGVWLDPRSRVARALGVRGLPTTLLIDRQGREVARLEGAAEWDSPAAIAAIRAV